MLILALAALPTCAQVPRAAKTETAAPPSTVRTTRFERDIQPIFDHKCIACHACYDAPCQLSLTSAQGLERGASKLGVYDTRLRDTAPTRLGIDALTVADWRRRDFWSVQEGAPGASLLARMLDLGDQHRWMPNARLPDELPLGVNRTNVCSTAAQMDGYANARPQQGMPLAVTGLTSQELTTLKTWMAEGAEVTRRTLTLRAVESDTVVQWEAWFNRGGLKERLVARYLYEHLFLGHLYVPGVVHPNFFQILRSSTSPGQPVKPLATVLPNDPPPDGQAFWYRLRPIEDTLVYKTHITYAIDAARLKRYEQLFFGEPWLLDSLPGYHSGQRANPFETFAAMPARGRYQFLLDNAEYFVRNFIRGPVCHGQVATDVIRDQFWTLFENPTSDRYVNNETYRRQVTPLLGVPGQDDSLVALGPEWELYRHRRNEYDHLREAEYARARPQGPSMSDLWDGDGNNPNALLTIFRHHDSASVHQGLIGAVPETIWVMDYPLLERTYYELVANYNVFGSVSHQLQTRLYFDLIRNSSELNFLRFLPPDSRSELLQGWYRGMRRIKPMTTYAIVNETAPTAVHYGSGLPIEAFAEQLYRHASPVMGPPDSINRCADATACIAPGSSGSERRIFSTLRSLTKQPAAQRPFIALLPEFMLLRVTEAGGGRHLFSILHNRAHTNVAFLFGEDRRLDPPRDTLCIAPGVLGSYPNFAFDLPSADLDAFARQLIAVTTLEDLHALAARWGVRRTHPEFWAIFNDFTSYLKETDAVNAAVLDMNRYENL